MDRGFTLIELLVVIAIIGILGAIAVPSFNAYKERAWEAKVQSMVGTFRLGEEAYNVDNEAYLDCTVDNGSSTCSALPGLAGVDLSGFSGITAELANGVLIGICHVRAPHGYAYVSDPGHELYTGGKIDQINLDGPGSCSLSFFSSVP